MNSYKTILMASAALLLVSCGEKKTEETKPVEEATSPMMELQKPEADHDSKMMDLQMPEEGSSQDMTSDEEGGSGSEGGAGEPKEKSEHKATDDTSSPEMGGGADTGTSEEADKDFMKLMEPESELEKKPLELKEPEKGASDKLDSDDIEKMGDSDNTLTPQEEGQLKIEEDNLNPFPG